MPTPQRPFRPGRRPPGGWARKTIIADLVHQIDTGILPPGTKLPSRAELADLYTVSRSTIMWALDPLIFSGKLRGEQGRGVFVAAPPDPPDGR